MSAWQLIEVGDGPAALCPATEDRVSILTVVHEGDVPFAAVRDAAHAHLIAAAPDLLQAARQFEETLVYYIKMDERAGDGEGARLKSMTLILVRQSIAAAEGRA